MSYTGYGLPGRFIRAAKPEELCEVCEDQEKQAQATMVIQGETDSFGYETIVCCDACNKKMAQENRENLGTCEWCKKEKAAYVTRDPDEGSGGPVYRICLPCNHKMNKYLAEELEFLEARAR